MAHQSFSQEVLGMLKDVCREGGKAEAGEMSSRLCLKTRKEHKRMLNTLSDLARQGRIVRVSQGVYAEAKPAAEPDKREVMWRLRGIRLKKKQVISKLDAIDTALGDIRQILKTMEEEQ